MFSKNAFAITAVSMLFSVFLQAQTKKETAPPETKPTHKWWNLLHYSISITPDYSRQFISGTNQIEFTASADSGFEQLAITDREKGETVRLQKVTDEEYKQYQLKDINKLPNSLFKIFLFQTVLFLHLGNNYRK